ncbi:FAD-dependent oxidoreductase, partial [Candidatus Latescibacterota bacterium]
RYIQFRNKIKEWYESRSEKQPVIFQPYFSEFEDFGTGNFCFENEAAVDVIYEMIEQHIDRERLIILNRHKVVKVTDFSERLASLDVVDLDNKVVNQVTGWMFIDASETGDLLSLCGIEYATGRESQSETGEPHAPETAVNLNTEDYYYIDPVTDIGTDAYEADLLKEKPSNDETAVKISLETGSRRMKAVTKITEQDISAEFRHGPRARFFVDSVGIGYALLTIFEPGSENKPVIVQTKPFQIPYRAFISPEYSNFIAGGQTIGTTFVASTAYNTPSVQWMIGESAGEIAAFCAGYNLNTHELMNSGRDFRKFRNRLVIKNRIPIYWYDDVSVNDPVFAEAQLRPFYDPIFHKFMKTLHYPGDRRPRKMPPFPRNR